MAETNSKDSVPSRLQTHVLRIIKCSVSAFFQSLLQFGFSVTIYKDMKKNGTGITETAISPIGVQCTLIVLVRLSKYHRTQINPTILMLAQSSIGILHHIVVLGVMGQVYEHASKRSNSSLAAFQNPLRRFVIPSTVTSFIVWTTLSCLQGSYTPQKCHESSLCWALAISWVLNIGLMYVSRSVTYIKRH